MTPAVLEQAGAGQQDGAASAVSNQALQLAFQQGVEHAREQIANEQQMASRQQRMEELEQLNQEQAQLLRERTEELQKREYRCIGETTRMHYDAAHLHTIFAASY